MCRDTALDPVWEKSAGLSRKGLRGTWNLLGQAQALLTARDAPWPQRVTLNTIGPGPVSEIASLDEAIERCDHGPAGYRRPTTFPEGIA